MLKNLIDRKGSALMVIFLLAFTCCAPLSAASKVSNPSGQAVLYYLPSCAHCKKVEAYLKSVNKKVIMKNILNSQYQQELSAMGQDGVPVLVVNGQVVVGSSSIISYLSKHQEVLR
jgi:glutaredoxin